MSGRASRARLLAPSFLVVASAIACGGTSIGSGTGDGGSPQTSGGTEGGGATNYGGSTNPPVPIVSVNPPAPSTCPGGTPPPQGSACNGPQTCEYHATGGNGCPSATFTVSCVSGAWQAMPSNVSCNPPPVVVCPPLLPPAGTSCLGYNSEGLMCVFMNPLCGREDAWCQGGVWHVSSCDDGAGGAGFGGAPSEAGTTGEGVGGDIWTGGVGGAP